MPTVKREHHFNILLLCKVNDARIGKVDLLIVIAGRRSFLQLVNQIRSRVKEKIHLIERNARMPAVEDGDSATCTQPP